MEHPVFFGSLKKENIEKWIELLESPNYRNSYGPLADLSGCCGLGKRPTPLYSPLGLLLVACGAKMSEIDLRQERIPEGTAMKYGITDCLQDRVLPYSKWQELSEIAEMIKLFFIFSPFIKKEKE